MHLQQPKNQEPPAKAEEGSKQAEEETHKQYVYDAFFPIDGKTKPIEGYGSITDGAIHRIRPRTTFMFHNSRPNRTAGKSMDTDTSQGIFYYEAISEGQEFMGEITATDPQDIADLLALLGTKFTCQMGRSRSAQYGSVEVQLELLPAAVIQPESSPSHHYYLVLDSPLILLNDMGEAQADKSLLNKALHGKGLDKTCISKAITQTRWVEQYNAIWQSKTPRLHAFSAGSVFELKSAPEDWSVLSQLRQLGEQRALGFGKLRLFPKEMYATPKETVESPHHAATGSQTMEPEELAAIRRLHQLQEQRTQAKIKAIDDAKSKRPAVPNHLSSWILSKLGLRRMNPDGWRTEWNGWLNQLKSKNQKAFRTLDEFRLFEPLLALQPLGSPDSQYQEDWGHQYWTTFLETLRKRNKDLQQ